MCKSGLQAWHDEPASKNKSKLWLRDGGCLIFNIRSLLLALELPVSLTTVSDVPADAAESSSTQPARWDESIEVVG